MVIGNGLIAQGFTRHFAADPDTLIFASGVSNSNELSAEAFRREEQKLRDALGQFNGLAVYFSTCSIEDIELHATPYVRHKLSLEAMVGSKNKFLIFRLPQIVGKTSNPFTLTNYLYQRISLGEPFTVWKCAVRNIIDIDDVVAIASRIIGMPEHWNKVINIANPRFTSILDLVKMFERILNKAAIYNLVECGASYDINITEAKKVAEMLGISFEEGYVEKVIRRYYQSHQHPNGTRHG